MTCQRLRGRALNAGKPMTATPKTLPRPSPPTASASGHGPASSRPWRAIPEGWLHEQLKGTPPVLAGEGLKPSSETLATVHRAAQGSRRGAAREEEGRRSDEEAQVATALKLPAVYRPVYIDEAYARFSHSVATGAALPRAAHAVLDQSLRGVDRQDRGARPRRRHGARSHPAARHGHFTDLLLAVEKHPAMLLYLDNQASIGPNSQGGAIRRPSRQRTQGRHQRKPRARDPRAAHARAWTAATRRRT